MQQNFKYSLELHLHVHVCTCEEVLMLCLECKCLPQKPQIQNRPKKRHQKIFSLEKTSPTLQIKCNYVYIRTCVHVYVHVLRISVWELLCHLACRGLHVLLWSIVRLGKCLVCCIIDSTLTWIVASSWSSMSVWSGLSWNQVQLCPPFGLGCGAAWTLSEVCFTYMLEGLACWLF